MIGQGQSSWRWRGRCLAVLVWAWGAWAHAGTIFEPSITLIAEERYDDDELLRTSGAGLSGQAMTRLTPQLGLELKSPTLTGAGWYAADLLLHHGTGSVKLDHRGELGARQRFSRLFELEGKAQLWRVADPTSLPRMGVARSLLPVLYGRAELIGRAELTDRLLLSGEYRIEGARIFDQTPHDGMVHGPSLELAYELGPRLELGGAYNLRAYTDSGGWAQSHALAAVLRFRASRQLTLLARAGPIRYSAPGAESWAPIPHVSAELHQDGRALDLTLALGQDLVGASGFAAALWAQYAQAVLGARPSARVRLFAAGSWFRNGPAPSVGLNPFGPDAGLAYQGYAVGGGVEWQGFSKLALVATFDRFQQVGASGPVENMKRNIAGVRLVLGPW